MNYTLEDIIAAVQYGFDYKTEAMNDGIQVPIGNTLQWLMHRKELIEVPEEFEKLKESYKIKKKMKKLLTLLLLVISLTSIAQLNIEGKNLTKEKFIAYEVIDTDTVFLGEFKHKYSLELDNTTRHRVLFVFPTFVKTLNIENTLEDNFTINIDLQYPKDAEISLVYNEKKNIFQIKNVMAKVK